MATHVLDLLAAGQAGVARVSLLGAARTLLALPKPPGGPTATLAVPSVRMDSAHGRLDAIPPPLTLNGATIEKPIAAYATANPTWAPPCRSGR